MPVEPVELYFKEYGEGPPLVILHGLLGASGNWHTLSRMAFAPRFKVYAVDLRNHGRSPHAEPFDNEAMAADLEAFLDARGHADAFVLGHSMGGKVAMHLALSRPERVARLVVVDIAPRAYPPTHEEILQALEAVDFSRVESRQDVDEQLAGRIPSRTVRQFLTTNLEYDSEKERYSWKMALEIIHRNYRQINEAVESEHPYDGPALFVRGAKSPYVRDEDEAGIREQFPAAQIATIEGAGHWVHAEASEELAELVVAFLES
jgi:pimeloyl-ACP methyl ester carboxylesterase